MVKPCLAILLEYKTDDPNPNYLYIIILHNVMLEYYGLIYDLTYWVCCTHSTLIDIKTDRCLTSGYSGFLQHDDHTSALTNTHANTYMNTHMRMICISCIACFVEQ